MVNKNSGFKGRTVQLERVEIAHGSGGIVLRCSVQFVDAEGMVHAIINHAFSPDPEDEPELVARVNTFLKSLITKIERIHFEATETGAEEVLHSIDEALQNLPTDDPIEQG